jgi:hypothetical protein
MGQCMWGSCMQSAAGGNHALHKAVYGGSVFGTQPFHFLCILCRGVYSLSWALVLHPDLYSRGIQKQLHVVCLRVFLCILCVRVPISDSFHSSAN